MLLRVGVVDEKPRVDPAAAGLEAVPGVPASDPPPPRDHPPPVRIAPEQLNDKTNLRPALSFKSKQFPMSALVGTDTNEKSKGSQGGDVFPNASIRKARKMLKLLRRHIWIFSDLHQN